MKRLSAAAAAMAGEGWQIDLLATDAAGHATELAAKALADGADLVIAMGGDGTVNESSNNNDYDAARNTTALTHSTSPTNN